MKETNLVDILRLCAECHYRMKLTDVSIIVGVFLIRLKGLS